ncbi:hypothetical protein [Paenibacillus sp. FSL W7-1287]
MRRLLAEKPIKNQMIAQAFDREVGSKSDGLKAMSRKRLRHITQH